MNTIKNIYSDKLKDPRWQKKRLEVMQADNFTCQICFHKDKTLNVHHKKYIAGREPWEYGTRELITLCNDCHAEYHREIRTLQLCSKLIVNS